ncbi:MAG: hypothetical protein US66_C0009G0002 [Candidatus Moranbacteria bacterium GW2011_GWD2_37_9]|nr:MAG: hypothetical protein US66_C0009G0002 [Candidatus Moranbacteria bacterium GW2011_GWD2_37_9]
MNHEITNFEILRFLKESMMRKKDFQCLATKNDLRCSQTELIKRIQKITPS